MTLRGQIRRGGWRWSGVLAAVTMMGTTTGCEDDAAGPGPQWDAGWPDVAAKETVATPEFDPGEGTFAAPQTVAIRTETAGATIRYTLDGSDPTARSPM